MSEEQQVSEAPELALCYCRRPQALSVKQHMDHGDFACKPRGFYVFCSNCWAGGPTASTEAGAISYWNKSRADSSPVAQPPIDMILFCPRCGTQHVDAEKGETAFRHRMEAFSLGAEWQDRVPSRWTNPPHRSHLCHQCGAIWRPADVPTNGAARIQTRGAEDNTWSNTVAVPAVAPKQDDADILDDERIDKELRRWQDGIRDKLIAMGAPDWKIDGAGCDSGDPLDFTLAEVGQGVGYFIDQLDELRAETLKGICVYCGEVQQYESLEQKSGAEGNQSRVEHIKKCTQRPELKLIGYCEALQDACQQFVHWYAEDSTEEKRDNAYDAAVAALALPAALTKPQPPTPPSAEVADAQIDVDWALRELADGWIQNNEREGPHGFYQNARRVLAAIANDACERQREVDAQLMCNLCRRPSDYHPAALDPEYGDWRHKRINHEKEWDEVCKAAAIRNSLNPTKE